MKIIKSYYVIISISLFIIFLIAAQIAAPDDYSVLKYGISALGAQGYDRKIIMQLGFLSFGVILSIGIILNGLSWQACPILIFALCIALTGIFCTKPFPSSEGISYSQTQSNFHAFFSKLAAVSFWIGIFIQMLFSKKSNVKIIDLTFLLLLAIVAFPLIFGILKNYQGIAQRILFLISFIWLVKFYKLKISRQRTTEF